MKQKSDSRYLEVFGDYPINRVLDFLFNQKNDLAMSDIARLSGVGYSTLKLFWPRLEKYQLVLNTRKVGKAKMYIVNRENEVVRSILKIYKALKHNI